MGMYRCQPQAKSHVYRSVLLGVSQRPADGAGSQARQPDTPADAKGQSGAPGAYGADGGAATADCATGGGDPSADRIGCLI